MVGILSPFLLGRLGLFSLARNVTFREDINQISELLTNVSLYIVTNMCWDAGGGFTTKFLQDDHKSLLRAL